MAAMISPILPTAARSRHTVGRLGGAILLACLLAGCASSFGELPAAVGGLPEGTPERSATPVAYPAVHDMPPPRNSTVLTADEQKKAEAELAAARTAQEKRAAAAARNQ
jgi:hypothetical protein